MKGNRACRGHSLEASSSGHCQSPCPAHPSRDGRKLPALRRHNQHCQERGLFHPVLKVLPSPFCAGTATNPCRFKVLSKSRIRLECEIMGPVCMCMNYSCAYHMHH